MKYLLFIMCATLLACGHSGPRLVTLPSGERGYSIRCNDTTECLEYVSDVCPDGYNIITNESKDGWAFSATNFGAFGKSTHRQTFVVQCRGTVVSTEPNPEKPPPTGACQMIPHGKYVCRVCGHDTENAECGPPSMFKVDGK